MSDDDWYDPSELEEMRIKADVEKVQARWTGIVFCVFWIGLFAWLILT